MTRVPRSVLRLGLAAAIAAGALAAVATVAVIVWLVIAARSFGG
jgi:hypothetical protein